MPPRVIRLLSLVIIRLVDLTGETGVGKEIRYYTCKSTIEVAFLAVVSIKVWEAKLGGERANLFWANDQLKFGTKVER